MPRLLRIACTLLPVLLSSCLAGFPPPDQSPLAQPELLPDQFFAGRTHGEGTLFRRFRATRHLQVEGVGQRDPDGTFRLEQTVTFDDGAHETRSWRLNRTAPNTWHATLSDAAGDVGAESSGNTFHLRYLIRQPRVMMEQWIYLQPDGRTVLNRATVSVLGVPWARLTETITRER
jgi:hypothetical protein